MMVVVAVMMVMAASAGGVGAGFGIEWRVVLLRVSAETFDHFGYDMVVPDTYLARQELHRKMTVAEMPGDAHQGILVMGVDVEHALRHGLHRDEPPVLQAQCIASAQSNGLGKVEHDFATSQSFEEEAATMAVVVVKQHGIGGFGRGPATGGNVFGRADHASVTYPRPTPAPPFQGVEMRSAPLPEREGPGVDSPKRQSAASSFRQNRK